MTVNPTTMEMFRGISTTVRTAWRYAMCMATCGMTRTVTRTGGEYWMKGYCGNRDLAPETLSREAARIYSATLPPDHRV